MRNILENTNGDFNKIKLKFNNHPNNLIPIILRHWNTHCSNPNGVTYTSFDVGAGCQLLSNPQQHLMLELAFNCENYEEFLSLCRFKDLTIYNLFHNEDDIYGLDFGKLTDAAINITSAILHNVFNINLNKRINILEFNSYVP